MKFAIPDEKVGDISLRMYSHGRVLQYRLNKAACRLRRDTDQYSTYRNPAQTRDRLAEIQKHASRLLKALTEGSSAPPDAPREHWRMQLPSVPTLPPSLRDSLLTAAVQTSRQGKAPIDLEPILNSNIDGVWELHAWALWAQRERDARTGARPPRTTDAAMQRFLVELANIWRQVFERPHNLSPGRDGHSPSPFLRFLRATLQTLDVNLDHKTIRTRMQRSLTAKRTPSH